MFKTCNKVNSEVHGAHTVVAGWPKYYCLLKSSNVIGTVLSASYLYSFNLYHNPERAFFLPFTHIESGGKKFWYLAQDDILGE